MAQRYIVDDNCHDMDDNGEWVRADDHEKEIASLKESLAALRESLASTKEALKIALKLCDYTY